MPEGALTFLLVPTLAGLYTQLHHTFHKSQSLYWAPGDAGGSCRPTTDPRRGSGPSSHGCCSRGIE
ncbi:unnamed protein product [Eretmochelys imbricata]